jgi:hypothetical protein
MYNTSVEIEQHWLPHVLVEVLSNFNINLGALYEASGRIENSYIRRNKFYSYDDRSSSGAYIRTWVALVITNAKVTRSNQIITGCLNGLVKI